MQRIGILAGGGRLPVALAEAVQARGGDVHIVGIVGEADPDIARFPHDWIKWGEIGRLVSVLRAAECREMVILGSVTRPDLSQVRLDVGGFLSLPAIVGLIVAGGDDAVLTKVVKFFEGKGFVVRGAHEVVPDLTIGAGAITRASPGSRDRADIERACAVVRSLGALDVGQSAIVARGHVLAVEAAEGTDAMISRAANLRQWGGTGRKRIGVLVKLPKPGQELRVDMPTIGPNTVDGVAVAGLSGIAVAAGHVLVAELDETRARADRHGIFIYGMSETG